MENEHSMKLVGKVIVIIIALTMLLPVGIITAVSPGIPSYDTILVNADDVQLQQIVASGAEVLVDYDNGYSLLKVNKGNGQLIADAGIDVDYMANHAIIRPGIAGIEFDWTTGEPDIPENLRAPADSDTYIVRFIGPMQPSWGESITNLGGTVHAYVADYGFTVKMDSATKDTVSDLPYVSWIGSYHPAYKISSAVSEKTSGNVMVTIIAFEGTDIPALAAELSNMGATVGQYVADDLTIKFTVDNSLIPAIASLSDIELMDLDGPEYLMDSKANQVHESVGAWYPSWSGLPQSLDGSGEVIGIQDSGFDEGDQNDGHCDFFDSPAGDRIVRYTDRTGTSDPDGADGSVAHGTHCAGIVASDGWCWETYIGESTVDNIWHLGEAGVAPRAELSLDGCSSGGGIASSSAYWDTQYSDGARTMSNSYGLNPANYGAGSITVDDQMDADDRMILFAASNDGPELDTLSPGSQAKNGLTVGANQNFRPDQFQSDNPNLVVDFSSRGGTYSNGRIKPDIVAVGADVISTFSRGEWDWNAANGYSNPQPTFIMEVDEYSYLTKNPGSDGRPDYQYMGGTSMACPMAAGNYALIREYLREIEGIAAPPSELTKAMLINGCDKMSEKLYEYPGYDQGWGRVNTKNSLFPDAPTTVQYDTNTFAAPGTWSPAAWQYNVVSDTVPLKITLVWKDVSGIALSRDLDLRVTAPNSDIFYGNAFTSTAPYWSQANSPANRPDVGHLTYYDGDNNVEQVWIPDPTTYGGAGVWTVEVIGYNIPSNTPCGIVMSADLGPQSNYDVVLTTDYPTTMHLVANSQVDFPFRVANYGNLADSILMSDDGPFSISYSPLSPFAIDTGEYVDVVATISAGAIGTGVYTFKLTGTSQGDPSEFANLFLTIEVLAQRLPATVAIANDDTGEFDPSVVTFTDNGGTSHIIVVYVKAMSNGNRVFVTYTTLNPTDGQPIEPWTEVEIPAPSPDYSDPNDLRVYWMSSGTYQDRVMLCFTGEQDGAAEGQGSSSWVAYADNADYGAWTTVFVDRNSGTSVYNYKRVNSLAPLASGDEFLYIFEHLDYSSLTGNPVGVDTYCLISSDGGDTWVSQGEITPGDGNFYFFPNVGTSKNIGTGEDVAWVWFYWRTPSGNDRDLRVRLYDPTNGWQALSTDVWDTTDNVQFPAPTHVNVAGTMRNMVSVWRDQLGTTGTLWTTYIDGDFDAANPPANSATGWGNTEGPFGTVVSDATYTRRPILCMAGTGDGYQWASYLESSNPYGVPNIDTVCSNDGFATSTTYTLTADAYAKGHQMMSALSTAGGDNMYEVYHSSHGTVLDVDYNIYLTMFHYDWPNAADTEGPRVTSIIANPNPVGLGYNYDISANIDDISTGFSGINAAEYYVGQVFNEEPIEPTWPGTAMTMSGGTQSETGTALGESIPLGAQVGDYFYVWVRGQDAGLVWGDGEYIKVYVTDGLPPPTVLITNPTGPIESGTITIAWDATDVSDPPETLDIEIEYSVDSGASWIPITSGLLNGAGGSGTYDWTPADPDGVNFLVRVIAINSIPLGGVDVTDTFSLDNIVDDEWFFQLQAAGVYQDLDMKPVESIANSVPSGDIGAAIPMLIETWETTETYTGSIVGPWTFNVYGYVDDPGALEAYMYAVIKDGSGVTLYETANDNENVGLFTDSHMFSWTDTPSSGSVTANSIRVEIWLDVVVGSGGSVIDTYVPNDAEFSASFWIVDAMPPTGANLNSETVFDAAMDTQASTSDDSRALSVDPANNWDEMFTWCDVTVSTDPAAITQIDLTFEGQGNAATDFDLWVLGPGGWAATGDSIACAADTDGTLTGTITVTPGDYIIGGLLTWGVYQTDSNDLIRVDLLETVITCTVTPPVFNMEYDYDTTQSSVEPYIATGGSAYNIPIQGPATADRWVFISFPYPMSGNIETVLDDSVTGGGGTTWDVAKWYNPQTPDDPWKTYRVGATTNDMSTIDNTMGVWIHLTAHDGGTLTTSTTGDYSGAAVNIDLFIGWNLVSYPSASPIDADATLPTEADFIAVYNDIMPYLIEDFSVAPGAVTMSEGNAYWVHVTGSNTVWNVAP